ncbi:septum site-determining protein MinC [Paenibacillus sp. KN14-4R]|uniref:septum site-determining protein MinC n=1 Tax=Paenibacillus sp. KN14-4R TaxID=3445773 RepID=UPI003F9FBB81
MTAERKQHVTLKGTKEGLVFRFEDTCEFEELLSSLRHMLEESHVQILSGPIVHVYMKLGKRSITEDQEEQIRDILRTKGNLLIQSIESDGLKDNYSQQGKLNPIKGIVRSGQILEHSGDLLFLGDVNPGGSIICTGSIYILGALRGMAHAGCEGEETAIIAASYMRPTQLRIAGIVSRSPDEWGIEEAHMEFAYIQEGVMQINKLNHLHHILP